MEDRTALGWISRFSTHLHCNHAQFIICAIYFHRMLVRLILKINTLWSSKDWKTVDIWFHIKVHCLRIQSPYKGTDQCTAHCSNLLLEGRNGVPHTVLSIGGNEWYSYLPHTLLSLMTYSILWIKLIRMISRAEPGVLHPIQLSLLYRLVVVP